MDNLLQEFWIDQLLLSITEDVFLTVYVYAADIECTNQTDKSTYNATFEHKSFENMVYSGSKHTHNFSALKNGTDLLCANRYELYIQKNSDYGRVSFNAELLGCTILHGKTKTYIHFTLQCTCT